MVSLRDIQAQDNAVRYLTNSLSSGRVASSFLFSGPDGVGRALTAKAFIMEFFCMDKSAEGFACSRCLACKRLEALEHPDLLWIKPEKNRQIRINEVRSAKEFLSLKPFEARVNVCVIEDAHMMNAPASNALLKVLEEPPEKSLLVLITSKKELLLPTVTSRCSEVRFRSLTVDRTKEMVMRASDADEETAYFLAFFSQGSPGRALEMMEEGLLDQRDDIIGIMEEIAKEENASCMRWGTDAKDLLLEDIDLLIMFFRDMTLGREGLADMALDRRLSNTGMYSFFSAYPAGKVCGIVEKLTELKKALLGNVNPKLVAQVLPGIIK